MSTNKNETFEIISYTLNVILAFLVIFFTFIKPCLLKCEYWTYILVALITAILFHTGVRAGKNT